MKSMNASKVIKENKEYYFYVDTLNNLYYEILGKEDGKEKNILHKEMISSNTSEFRVFVEDNENIYILFKKNNELKCAYLNGNNLNVGSLYSCSDSIFDISEADMFIVNHNIHVLAVLRNKQDKNKDVVIHYLYRNGEVESNIICPVTSKKNKNYQYILHNNEVRVFYSIVEDDKNVICFKSFKDDKWGDIRRVLNLCGQVKDIDIRLKKDRMYLGIIYSNYGINVLKVIIFNKDLNLIAQKTYYDIEDLKEVNFIDEGEDIFITWQKCETYIITSSLLKYNFISTYLLTKEIKNMFICKVSKIENDVIDRYKIIGFDIEDKDRKFIDIKKIIEENKKNQQDVFQYSNNILKILGLERRRERNVEEKLQLKLQRLQQDIMEKQEQLKDATEKQHSHKMDILKETYENNVSNLIQEKEKLCETIESLEVTNTALNRNRELLQDKIRKVKRENDEIIFKAEKSKKELSEKLAIVKEHLNKTLDEYKNKLEKINNEVEQLRSQNHILVEKNKEKSKVIDKLQISDELNDSYNNELEKLKQEKKQLQEDLNAAIQLRDVTVNEYEIRLKQQEEILQQERVKSRGIFSKLFNK